MSFTELTLNRTGIQPATAEQVLKGYNSVRTFSKAQQEAFAERYLAEHPTTAATAEDPRSRRNSRCPRATTSGMTIS